MNSCLTQCGQNPNCYASVFRSNGTCYIYDSYIQSNLIDDVYSNLYTIERPIDTIGLVNYWPINNDLKDYTGSADLIYVGNGSAAIFAPDRFQRVNSSIYVNNTYYQAPNGVYFADSSSFTVMGWIKLVANLAYSCFFSFGNGASSDDVYLCFSSSSTLGPYFGLWNGSSTIALIQSAPLLSVDTWLHFCGTWDGRNATLYINGSEAVTSSGTGQLNGVVRKQCYIGLNNWPNCPAANAYFDDIRIYNRALSQSEILTQMQATD